MYHSTNKHISKLISKVPQDITSLSFCDNNKEKLNIARNIVHFLKDEFQEEYNTLKFNPKKHTLDSLLKKTLAIVFKNNYTLKINLDETTENQKTTFVKDIHFNADYKTINATAILQLKTPLRIGLAKFITSFSKYVTNFNNAYPDQDIIYSFEGQEGYFESAYEEFETKTEKRKFKRKLYLFKNKLERLNHKIEQYSQEDLSKFDKYIPRTKENKVLKQTIKNLLDCDLKNVFNLEESFDSANDGATHFRWLYAIHCNDILQEDAIKEIEYAIHTCNYSEPCSYFSYDNGTRNQFSDQKTILDFQKLNENLTLLHKLTA